VPTKMLPYEEVLHATTKIEQGRVRQTNPHALTPELLRKMNAYWRAATMCRRPDLSL